MAVTCVVCGAVADGPPDEIPLGWSTSSSDRGMVLTCPTCVREHVRSIEAKLDESWW